MTKKLIFTTKGLRAEKRLSSFRDAVVERMGVPIQQTSLQDDQAFSGKFEALRLGSLSAMRVIEGPLKTAMSPAVFRRYDRGENLSLSIKLSGESKIAQGDRISTQRAGDLMVLGGQPFVGEAKNGSSFIQITIPRHRLEDALGVPKLFSGLIMPAHQGSARLVRSFFEELFNVQVDLDAATSDRMTSIGIDLVIASLAERMARETPKHLQDAVYLQRAKAYVEGNLGDPTLDPAGVAAAVGISLRRLQVLFQEQGKQIADWIWQRRLELAARRLSDPGYVHLAIGLVGFGCGFMNQSHFARRFRERFDLTPSEYRAAALVERSTQRSA